MRARTRGFTLMEVLCVVAIIGILFALVCPVVVNVRCHSRSEASQAHLHDFCLAVKSWQTDHGRWPAQEPGCSISTAGLVPLLEGAGPGGRPYYSFKPDSVAGGAWKNLLGHPYRYRTDSTTPLWNKGGFDAWAKGCGDSAGNDSMPQNACSITNR